jgi:lipoate-protein ligase A
MSLSRFESNGDDHREMAGTFSVTWARGPTDELVRALPDRTESVRSVRICEVTDRAIVLGSSQPKDVIDDERANAAGVSAARRRAGGGAVLVEPGSQHWCDVFVPAGDPLHESDVGVAFHWLGDVFAEVIRAAASGASAASAASGASALSAASAASAASDATASPSAPTVPSVTVHKGALVSTKWSRLLCFCGIGPGEVLVDGRKVLGLAQRRNREGSWLHAMVPYRLDAAGITDVLRLDEPSRQDATAALAAGAAPIGIEPSYLVAGLLDALAGVDLSR